MALLNSFLVHELRHDAHARDHGLLIYHYDDGVNYHGNARVLLNGHARGLLHEHARHLNVCVLRLSLHGYENV